MQIKSFFNAKGNELTDEQKNAIITLEDRNLLIAIFQNA